jgi:hypothetical protein
MLKLGRLFFQLFGSLYLDTCRVLVATPIQPISRYLGLIGIGAHIFGSYL